MTKRNLRRLAFQVLAATLALAGPSAMIVKAEATPRSPEGPSSSLETVSGRVKDSTGAVIVGATVTLRAAAGAFSRSVGTDQLGRYRFEGFHPAPTSSTPSATDSPWRRRSCA